jgi:hypothetical protein
MARKPRKGATKGFLKALNAMPLRKSEQFHVGDPVTHINHGDGKIIALSEDTTAIIVEFDHEVEGFGDRVLEVSIACLKKKENK